MDLRTRRGWTATIFGTALLFSPAPTTAREGARCADAGEGTACHADSERPAADREAVPDGHGDGACSVTVYEHRLTGGDLRRVEKTVCGDGTVRTAERRYDASGRVVASREYEITADGAVRLVAQSGQVSAPAAESRSAQPQPQPQPKPRKAIPEASDRARAEAWLNAKFKEWSAASTVPDSARAGHAVAGRD